MSRKKTPCRSASKPARPVLISRLALDFYQMVDLHPATNMVHLETAEPNEPLSLQNGFPARVFLARLEGRLEGLG